MSYQVLARKWRPQNFRQMVGQEHVLQALIHALESQRLHHAYLFTGTRGVGKTTIGRILAKCLSCEQGVGPEPCGQCGACTAIAQGRYVDLIEIDAASRTKVEDMRELLDNVQYAPSQGQYKIYLIDEVHMLSQSSFNALLKTLEEPPEHVKFLFATTDPQKLPVTILSRCLQFNLKNMSPERIVQHLGYVLGEEQISYEDAALWALARAADGSMRDALSLTDQAIAYGNHALTEKGVSAMLGTVDQKQIYRILAALVSRDAPRMLEEIAKLAEFSPDYREVLASLVSLLHRIAVEQAVPGATDNAMGDQEYVQQYAKELCAEDVQLYYQIALTSRQDLNITPDARAGFEMALLRMLAFQLQAPQQQTALAPVGKQGEDQPGELVSKPADSKPAAENVDVESVVVSAASENPLPASNAALSPEPPAPELERSVSESSPVEPAAGEPPAYDAPPIEAYDHVPMDETAESGFDALEAKKKTALTDADASIAPEEPRAVAVSNSAKAPAVDAPTNTPPSDMPQSSEADQDSWPIRAASVPVSGMTQNLLLNMALQQDHERVRLYVDAGHYRLLNDNHRRRIIEALPAVLSHHGEPLQIEFVEGLEAGQETPMMWRERRRAEMQEQAKALIQNDENVRQLIETFDARVIEESIEALGALH